MNEEENQAFKILSFYNPEDYRTEELKKCIKIIVNLVEKQQKQIEELRETCNKYNDMKYFAMVADRYISKDKIKEKIKELESHIWKDGYMTKFDKYTIHYLNELLGV